MRVFGDFDFFGDTGEFQWEVAKRGGVGGDGKVGLRIAKAVVRDTDCIVTGGDSVELKFAFVVGECLAIPVGGPGLQRDISRVDRAMLGVMNDAADGAEDAGEGRAY